jgi:hypothetical protein
LHRITDQLTLDGIAGLVAAIRAKKAELRCEERTSEGKADAAPAPGRSAQEFARL